MARDAHALILRRKTKRYLYAERDANTRKKYTYVGKSRNAAKNYIWIDDIDGRATVVDGGGIGIAENSSFILFVISVLGGGGAREHYFLLCGKLI